MITLIPISEAEYAADQERLLRSRRHVCLIIRGNEHFGGRQPRHGMTATKEHYCWLGLKQRCTNPKSRAFKYYGQRGIRVCKAWLKSFEAFLRDMGKAPTAKHSIDRINNDGNYTPANCRWATPKQQARNRRRKVALP